MAEYYGRRRLKLQRELRQLIVVEVLRLLRRRQRCQRILLETLHLDLKLQWRRVKIREDRRLHRRLTLRQQCYAGQPVEV